MIGLPRDFQPFVPPAPPPPMFRIEIFPDTLGLAEILAAISVFVQCAKNGQHRRPGRARVHHAAKGLFSSLLP
jgi:hypothetical protein